MLHDASKPASSTAATKMMLRLPNRLAHLRSARLDQGPFWIVSVHDTGQARAVLHALTAYPGLTVPTLHGCDPHSLLSTTSLHAVPDAVYELLWDYNGRTDLRIYTDETELPSTTTAPGAARFAEAVVAQLRHRHREGSDVLASCTERAVVRVGLEPVLRILLDLPPVRDGELASIGAALDAATA